MGSEDEPARLRESMVRAISMIEGYLHPAEAWELHEMVRRQPHAGSITIVEIGSLKGRSTVALALGLRARRKMGGGRLFAIDPFDLEPQQLDDFKGNLKAAHVADLVEPIQALSHNARSRFADRSVHAMFIDGSHHYEDVKQDIEDWTSALVSGAVVGFNDPWIPGVGLALIEATSRPGSPLRRPKWVVNSVFFEFRPTEAWTKIDDAYARRLERFIKVGRRWIGARDRIRASSKAPTWARDAFESLNSRFGRTVLKRILPLTPSTRDWDR